MREQGADVSEESDPQARFQKLIDELEVLLARRGDRRDHKRALDDAARRYDIERELILLMSPMQAPSNRTDRRRNVRVACELVGRIRVNEEEAKAVARDLSVGGVMIETSVKLSAGTELAFSLDPQKGLLEFPVTFVGKVAWVKPTGVGVSFTKRSDGSDHRITQLVVNLLRKRGSQLSK